MFPDKSQDDWIWVDIQYMLQLLKHHVPFYVFLVKATFWTTVLLLLFPAGPAPGAAVLQVDATAWDVYKLPWPGEHWSQRGKVHPALGGYYPPEEEAGTGPITGKAQRSGPPGTHDNACFL